MALGASPVAAVTKEIMTLTYFGCRNSFRVNVQTDVVNDFAHGCIVRLFIVEGADAPLNRRIDRRVPPPHHTEIKHFFDTGVKP
jgi:hypothetical protein